MKYKVPVYEGDGNSTLQVQLFPNTGHHYYFMPITNLTAADPEVPEISDWLELFDEHGNPCKWGRYRWGMKNGEHGVWYCLETNLGNNKRGSVYVSNSGKGMQGEPPKAVRTPYLAEKIQELKAPGEFEILYLCPDGQGDTGGKQTVAWAKLEVGWRRALSQCPINVDLVIDFGNSRTVVLMNEQPMVDSGASPTEALAGIVKPVPYLMRDEVYSDDLTDRHILPSWFINQQPHFASSEPPVLKESEAVREFVLGPDGNILHERRRVPQMFVEMAPVTLGHDAWQILGDIDLADGGRYFLSSPKRYVWDNEVPEEEGASVFWCMVNNPWVEGPRVTPIAANVLRFMPGGGGDWDFSKPPNELPPAQRPKSNPAEPIYPNADAMTWVALALIENAYRQMNAAEFVQDNNPNIRRKLHSVQVTFPSGWTKPEMDCYVSKWNKAVNIFAHNHLDHHERPELHFPIDEAVASQLPMVFAGMLNMGGEGDNWLELIGRPPPAEAGQEASHRARVMTIDIGGGTTDYAIIEYEDLQMGPGVILHAKLLFKDSTNVAGDHMVLNLIQKLLLPLLGANLNDEVQRDAFRTLFKHSDASYREKEEWKRITRLVLLRKVYQWLEDICAGREPAPDHPQFHRPTLNKLNEFAKRAGHPGNLFSNAINVSSEEINGIIRDTFENMLNKFAHYVAAFDVDQVILCGKPSELPIIGDILRDAIPLEENRIIQAKGFYAGTWYPFNNAGKITDAKTVTAVGLALQTAIQSGKIHGWHIETSVSEDLQTNNYWLSMGHSDDERVILDPMEDESSVTILPNSYIGRRLLPWANAEQVYVLDWCGDPDQKPMQLNLGICRKYIQGQSEELEITWAEDAEGEDIMESVRLRLCTLAGDRHWIDNPSFDILWEEDSSGADMYF